MAWGVGLPCGGEIDVFVERCRVSLLGGCRELARLRRARRALHRRRGRRRSAAKELVLEGGERIGDGVPDEATGQFDELIRRGRNQLLELDGG